MTTAQREAEAEYNVLKGVESTEVLPDGYTRVGDDVAQGTEGIEQATIQNLEYKGYVQIWDTKTGVISLQPKYMLWQTLRLRHEDGSLQYTPTNPMITPDYGQDLFCPMNPKSAEYYQIADMGFKPCRKQHIPNQDAVQTHVTLKHKRGAAALQRARDNRIRDEDREMQRESIRTNNAMIEALAGRVVTQAEPTVNPKAKAEFQATCGQCGKMFAKRSQTRANGALRLHQLNCKVVS
jgi:hypothetical protein